MSRALASLILLVSGGLFTWSASAQAPTPAGSVTVYKSPTCGCCSKWIEHDVEDIAAIKSKHGVPAQAASCHTALVDGYVVEGHVPADVVKRMLRERPKVSGIATPGMPMGSPGMEVPSGTKEAYAILAFDASGKQTVFDRR